MTTRRDVLVIDDELFVCDVYGRILSIDGYSYDLATSGVEAVRLMEEEGRRYRVALVDFVMPVMNGLETARRLLRVDPSLRIVFSTGSLETEHLRDDDELSGAELLLKPFSPSDLRGLLARLKDGAIAA